MQIQIFTLLRLLRKARFSITTQSICHHTERMNAPVEELTSSIEKRKTRWRRLRSIDQNNQALVIFSLFKVGNLG